jgi:hypothetical protein
MSSVTRRDVFNPCQPDNDRCGSRTLAADATSKTSTTSLETPAAL